ncbi:MAG: hypothetical protein JXA30_20045 [Deltaproteobacteria bacterium]|nr:hypothetical protein [Deltaproteobacteria bacterium]
MAAKEILFNTNARDQIAHGLNALANAVKVTLGPRGRNVLLEKSWGAPTITKDGVTVAKEIELENQKKARVEDALHATRAAVEEGIVPGGGVALLRTLSVLSKLKLTGEQQYGVNVICRALEEPLRQIAQNSGSEGAVVVNKVRKGKDAYGYNALSGEYEDLFLSGVIDPTKVVRVALQNAASVAALMLTTEVAIAERPKKSSSTGQGMHDAMGPMGM